VAGGINTCEIEGDELMYDIFFGDPDMLMAFAFGFSFSNQFIYLLLLG